MAGFRGGTPKGGPMGGTPSSSSSSSNYYCSSTTFKVVGFFVASITALALVDSRLQLQQAREEIQGLRAKLRSAEKGGDGARETIQQVREELAWSAHAAGDGASGNRPHMLRSFPSPTQTPSARTQSVENSTLRLGEASSPTGLPQWTEEQGEREDISVSTFLPHPGPSTCTEGLLGLAEAIFPHPNRILEWHPRPDKFLVALCYYGRLTNNLMCIQRYMAFAALLNRTLLVPKRSLSTTGDVVRTIDMAFDIGHAQSCLGNGRLYSLEGFLFRTRRPSLDVVAWKWVGEAGVTWQHIGARLPQLKLKGNQPEGFRRAPIWFKDVSLTQFLDTFGPHQDEAISFGDVFLVEGKEGLPNLYEGPNGPLKPLPTCQLIMQPHHTLIQAAEELVESALGRSFVSIHMRRTDFSSHCQREGFNCWYPLRQLAECLAARLASEEVAHRNITSIYVATDAWEAEYNLFKDMVLQLSRRPFLFIRLSRHWATQFSGVKVLRSAPKVFLDKPQSLALLEKIICSHGLIFWGSVRSTFSKDVLRMRLGFRKAHCLDHYICGILMPEKIQKAPTLSFASE